MINQDKIIFVMLLTFIAGAIIQGTMWMLSSIESSSTKYIIFHHPLDLLLIFCLMYTALYIDVEEMLK